VHSAKGLEFASVFITGLEEGPSPTNRACRRTTASRKSGD